MAKVRGFRFIHASDFHLEQPPRGLTEVPDHLRDLLLDAAYEAAGHVFHFAIEQEVDFVVLAGDLLDADTTGPRGPLFLIDHFQRLGEHGIEVYWAGSPTDGPERWPEGFPLPDNVRQFPAGSTAEFLFQQGGFPVARLLGQSRVAGRRVNASDYTRDANGLFTLGVLHAAEAELSSLESAAVDYWALGGEHIYRPALGSRRTLHYPGSPQGRTPEDTAVHNCLLVHVEGGTVVETRPLATDAMRWCEGRVSLPDSVNHENLRELLEAACEQQVAEISAGGAPITHLVRWIVSGPPHLTAPLQHSKQGAAILTALRNRYGRGVPPIWSISLQADYQAPLPEDTTAQENFLGDFLRTVARYAEGEQERKLELQPFLDPETPESLQRLVRLRDQAARQRILSQVAHLGCGLLSGQEVDG